MGGPLSVTLSDIHMIRTENNAVKLEKTLFYRRFVDAIINRRIQNEYDIILSSKNKFNHQSESLKVLDTKIINN